MEELLPGLLKMIDQRVGSKTATAFMWLVVLGFSALMLNLIWRHLVAPVSDVITYLLRGGNISWEDVSGALGAISMVAMIISVIILILALVMDRKTKNTSKRTGIAIENAQNIFDKASNAREEAERVNAESRRLVDRVNGVVVELEKRKYIDEV